MRRIAKTFAASEFSLIVLDVGSFFSLANPQDYRWMIVEFDFFADRYVKYLRY